MAEHIQLLTIKQIEENGVYKTYYPGDWPKNIGRQTALLWVQEGIARYADNSIPNLLPAGSGIVMPPGTPLPTKLKELSDLQIMYSADIGLPFSYTLLWDGQTPLRIEKLQAGFHELLTWQVVCPLVVYDVLAKDVGTDDDREYTQSVIRELRVPLYQAGLVWLKRCEDTERFVANWQQQTGDKRLAFLRALYECKPLICPLPYTWAVSGGVDKYAG